jgi:hypothetical protein
LLIEPETKANPTAQQLPKNSTMLFLVDPGFYEEEEWPRISASRRILKPSSESSKPSKAVVIAHAALAVVD